MLLQTLQKRKQQQGQSLSIDERMQLKAKANGVVDPDQHNQLMDEFKKAHMKMFKGGSKKGEEENTEQVSWNLYCIF